MEPFGRISTNGKEYLLFRTTVCVRKRRTRVQQMQLARASKTSDRFGRYYTGGNVAALLVDEMGVHSPNLVIDLGVGDGALVGAASRKWAGARFITVDIDACAGRPQLHGQVISSMHHVEDALGNNLSQRIGVLHEPLTLLCATHRTFAEMAETFCRDA